MAQATKTETKKKQLRRYISDCNCELTLRKGYQRPIYGAGGVILTTEWAHPIKVVFSNRMFETDDEEVQAMLEAHNKWGGQFYWHVTMEGVVPEYDKAVGDRFQKAKMSHSIRIRRGIRNAKEWSPDLEDEE